MHRASLDEEAVILVEPIGDHSPEEPGSDHIQTLRSLLTFATLGFRGNSREPRAPLKT